MRINRDLQFLRDAWEVPGHGDLADLSGISLVAQALGTIRYRDLRNERRTQGGAGGAITLGVNAAGTVPVKLMRWVRYVSLYLSPFAVSNALFLRLSDPTGAVDIDLAAVAPTAATQRFIFENIIVPERCNLYVFVDPLSVGNTLVVDSSSVVAPIGEPLPRQA